MNYHEARLISTVRFTTLNFCFPCPTGPPRCFATIRRVCCCWKRIAPFEDDLSAPSKKRGRSKRKKAPCVPWRAPETKSEKTQRTASESDTENSGNQDSVTQESSEDEQPEFGNFERRHRRNRKAY